MRILVTKQGNVIIQEIDDTMPLLLQNLNSTTKIRGYSTNYSIRKPKIIERYQNNLNQLSKTNITFRKNSNDILLNGGGTNYLRQKSNAKKNRTINRRAISKIDSI